MSIKTQMPQTRFLSTDIQRNYTGMKIYWSLSGEPQATSSFPQSQGGQPTDPLEKCSRLNKSSGHLTMESS